MKNFLNFRKCLINAYRLKAMKPLSYTNTRSENFYDFVYDCDQFEIALIKSTTVYVLVKKKKSKIFAVIQKYWIV